MTDKATLEAVARAIAGARWEDAYAAVWKSKERFADDMWMHYRNLAQAAIDAMPGWQPVTLTDIAVRGVRQAVHLQHEDLFVDYSKEGTFRLEFTQEQMRDLYNNIGAALHMPLPEPPE